MNMRFNGMRRVTVTLVATMLTAGAQSADAQRASPQTAAEAVVPFTIRVSDDVLTDLKQRLSRARFADEFADAGWNYGTNLAYLKSLVEYWRDSYDWRVHEKRLNTLNQFKTTIDDIDIHFVHQRSNNPNARPLLLLNGWPSSILEYTKVIGPLTDPVRNGGRMEDSFHLVIPSMPGFGFSDKPRAKGYDTERIARMWVTLMARLGYDRYAVHGSDWGSNIATRVALNDPAHVAALHLAGCGGAPTGPAANTAAQANPARPPLPVANSAVNAAHNLGYQEIQSTKPQTLGQGLSDSPVGLASWIVEKWYGWSDHEGDLDKVLSKDDLLTNIMIYWVTNSITSSSRLYYESRHMLGGLAPTPFPRPEARVSTPTGCGAFPAQYDRRGVPHPDATEARKGADTRYNVVHFTTMPRGGHFPAFEQPTLWVNDIREFLRGQR